MYVKRILILNIYNFTGKYPHILVSSAGKPSNSLNSNNHEAEIKFSPTPVGTTIQKWVELHNLAPVRFLIVYVYIYIYVYVKCKRFT